MSEEAYPHYEIGFKSATIAEDSKATVLPPGGVKDKIVGPHAIILAPSKNRIQISVAHHDEGDLFPFLNITVTDLD